MEIAMPPAMDALTKVRQPEDTNQAAAAVYRARLTTLARAERRLAIWLTQLEAQSIIEALLLSPHPEADQLLDRVARLYYAFGQSVPGELAP
jgi:hypothetical protein